ncbi:SixA phosphatase family protein [Alkalisalibacterium limincola]|uniref:Histidine phosphatase family protein n=1 Tax=Alkalisalibacterium limincola TaxID=2699169 RepID=A0A5C8KKZ4_9GAMM|nr:histidine phosphatase family protein [Alkalisalibacterium limincola]TXK60753.1 histidine phosphatase family protein [Alkalisalibacterium limincola]
MHRLILFRHAHAESPRNGQPDLERPLSATGEAEAIAAAAWLVAQDLVPDRVVCSTALRTRQTLERVEQALGSPAAKFDERIYEATPGELIEVAESHRDAGCVMLVGHNPGFEQLAALLTSGQTGDYRGMPPGGIAVVELPASDTSLEPGAGRLAAFWSP